MTVNERKQAYRHPAVPLQLVTVSVRVLPWEGVWWSPVLIGAIAIIQDHSQQHALK